MKTDAILLRGKTALVTGAAGGIGSATARLLAARGASVALADRDLAGAHALAEEIGAAAWAVPVELADQTSIEAMIAATVERFGRLDVLHNNAGYLGPEVATLDRDIETLDIAFWDRTFSVNLRGTMLVTRFALPHLRAAGGGSIINTTSVMALQGQFSQTAYSTTKAGIIHLTRCIAATHGRYGIRCNAVAPGLTITPQFEKNLSLEFRREVESETLLGQLTMPEDVAQTVAFLASDAAKNITGQVIVSDGGLSSHVPGVPKAG